MTAPVLTAIAARDPKGGVVVERESRVARLEEDGGVIEMGIYLFMHLFVFKPFAIFDLFILEISIQVCLAKTFTISTVLK